MLEQYDNGDGTRTNVGLAAPLPVAQTSPGGAAAQVNALASGANSAATATLAAATGKRTWLSGFQITGLGATAAGSASVTVAGLAGGSLQYVLAVPAGVSAGITPLVVAFAAPLAGSAPNTAITVTVGAFGAGNTAAVVTAQGFQI